MVARVLAVLITSLILVSVFPASVLAHCPPFCPPPTPIGNEGCTLGFWKNHPEVWSGFSTGQTLEEIFNVPDAFGLDNFTLLQALSLGGGEGLAGMARNLLRQAVAAILNASHPSVDYPVSLPDIIADVNLALTGSRGTMETLKNRLDTFNNLGDAICR